MAQVAYHRQSQQYIDVEKHSEKGKTPTYTNHAHRNPSTRVAKIQIIAVHRHRKWASQITISGVFLFEHIDTFT